MAVLTSGGAKGADSIFTEWAMKVGDTIYNLSFNEHRTSCVGRVILTPEQLEQANPMIEKAAIQLGKRVPKEGFVKKLIQRNYYQIRKTEVVIAIAPLTSNQTQVQGGTGWAVAMAIALKKPIYVFDFSLESEEAWFCYNHETKRFAPSKQPSLPNRYAGIGSRELNMFGVQAIQKLYESWYPSLMRK